MAYIAAWILLGPEVLNVFERSETITGLGDLGVVPLMFFIGGRSRPSPTYKKFYTALAGGREPDAFQFCIYLYTASVLYLGYHPCCTFVLYYQPQQFGYSIPVPLKDRADAYAPWPDGVWGAVDTGHPGGTHYAGLNFMGEGTIPIREIAKAVTEALLCGLFL